MVSSRSRRQVATKLLWVMCAFAGVSPLAAQAPLPNEIDPPGGAKPVLGLDSGGHTNAVYKLLPSTYSNELISVSLDKTIRLWDPTTGEPRAVLHTPIGPGPQGFLFCCAISPDGRLFAVGGYRAQTPLYDHRIHLISWPDGQLVRSLKGHVYAIYDMAFSPDGKHLASASHDGTLRIWDVSTGESERTLRGHSTIVHAVAWSPDGKKLVSGSYDKTARIWSAESGESLAELRDSRGGIPTVVWSPDGRTIAVGSEDKSVRLYEPSGKLRYTWPNLPNDIMALAFAPDSTRLLYTCGSNSGPPTCAGILELKDGRESRRYSKHPNCPVSCCWLDGGKLVATGDTASEIHLWDPTSGATIRKLVGAGRAMVSAGWSPDGQAIAWGYSNEVSNDDLTGKLDRTFCVRRLDFGPPPNNTFLRAKSRLGPLRIGLATEPGAREPNRLVGVERNGALIAKFSLPDPDDHVRSYTLLPGELAAVGTDSTTFVFDINAGRIRRQLADRGGEVWGLAPNADFRYLLATGNDQMAHVWRLADGQLLLALFVAGNEWIAWTPQGYYAASLAGESLMGWHINNGPEQMASYYSASQFHKSLYRPDMIRRVLETGDLGRALEIADKERESQSRPLVVADVLPPKVRVTSPAEPSVDTPDGSLAVEATAQAVDEDPVTAMRLIVDGRPWGPAKPISSPPPLGDAAPIIRLDATAPPDAPTPLDSPAPPDSASPGSPEPQPGPSKLDGAAPESKPAEAAKPDASAPAKPALPGPVAAKWNLQLPPGKHTVRVKAETAHSYGLSPALEARRESESPPPGTLRVLAIGGAPDQPSSSPSPDGANARSIAKSLADAGAGQFEKVESHTLVVGAATAGAIASQFDALRRNATAGDTTVVIYSGPVAADGVQARFLGRSAAGQSGAGGWSGQELKSQLAPIPGHVAFVMDARRQEEETKKRVSSGFCGIVEEDAGNRADTVVAELLRELLTEDYGVVVIGATRSGATGSRPAGTAGSSTAGAGGSPLARALSEGLGGKADANQDGVVRVKELGSYVTGRVRELTGGAVTPTAERPGGVRSFPLGRAPSKPTAKP